MTLLEYHLKLTELIGPWTADPPDRKKSNFEQVYGIIDRMN